MRERLRQMCLDEIADVDSQLSRKAHKLVHNLNDMTVDLGERQMAMNSREVLHKADDTKVVQDLGILADVEIENPEALQRSKVSRTSQ